MYDLVSYRGCLGLIEKFDRYLTAVYRNEGVTIYRVDLPLIEEQQP